MTRKYPPRARGVQFSAGANKPSSPNAPNSSGAPGERWERGRMLQFRVSAPPKAQDAQDAPASASGPSATSSGGAGRPPQLIDADTGSTDASGEPSSVPASVPAGVASASGGSTPASQQGVQMLILHAVSGWVAVVRERVVYSIQIAPMGSGTFEVEATLAASGSQGSASEDPADVVYLRVSCSLGAGKLVRTEVQPLGPR